ncbi:MAG: hypothetical protein PVJ84_07635 [Desulfobacteraceae bacterium]
MKIHQILCPPCAVIQQQFRAMRSACRFAPEDDTSADTAQLSDDACSRMKAALGKALQDKDMG